MEKEFGSYLQSLRKEKGWTQKELGEKIHVSDKTVSKWENNLSVPSIDMLESLARAFQRTLPQLLSYGEENGASSLTVDILEQTHRQNEELRRKTKRTIGIALIAMILALIAMGIYFQSSRIADRKSVQDTISMLMPGGESAHIYPFRIPKGAKRITLQLADATAIGVDTRELFGTGLSDLDLSASNREWKIILIINQNSLEWTYKLVDDSGNISTFWNNEPLYEKGDKEYGAVSHVDKPSQWNDGEKATLTPVLGEPLILYSNGLEGSSGLTSFGNDRKEINDLLRIAPDSLSRVISIELLIE